jgi:hypothetical protein
VQIGNLAYARAIPAISRLSLTQTQEPVAAGTDSILIEAKCYIVISTATNGHDEQ